MFDALIREAASQFGLGDKSSALVQSLISYIFREQPGALNGLIDQFKKAGLGDTVSSWIGGTAKPREITSDKVESVFGADVIGRIASAAGLAKSVALPAVSYLLPKIIGLLTRDGIPTGIPASVSHYLAAPVPRRVEEPNPMRWLWWLLLPLALLLLWRWCAPAPVPVPTPTPTPTPIPTAVPTPVPTPVAALPASVFFATNEQTLDAEDGSVIAAVVAYLKANPSVKVDITGYADKTGSQETNEQIAKDRAKSVREALEAAGIGEDRINMKPPVFITGSGNDTVARRVDVTTAT